MLSRSLFCLCLCVSKVSQNSLKSLSKVSQKSLKVAQKWGKMSTIILQLGQYVHLPKVCAIWGKISWGKMSLGHFVLGHFVLGAKCPWGKMSPSRFFLQKMRKHFKHIVCALFILTVHSLFSSQASISQAISKGWSIIVMWPDLWHSFHQLQNEITENNWNNFKVECLKRLLKN